MSNTPTDAEIVAVMRDGYNCRYNGEQDHIDFARAVLAKWGTPQPENLGFTIENRAGIDVLVWEASGCQPATSAEVAMWKALAAVQQPVVREPLTVQEVEQLLAQWSYELHGDRARYLVRMTEAVHGIKGGQHGTE